MISDADLAYLIKHEALRLNAYRDTAGFWTIGVGHLVTKDKNAPKPEPITREQAMVLLKEDATAADRAISRLVRVPLTENQRRALLSFVFNVGARAFAESTLLRLLNARDYKGAADQLLRWNKSGGKVTDGLVTRREDERALFLS